MSQIAGVGKRMGAGLLFESAGRLIALMEHEACQASLTSWWDPNSVDLKSTVFTVEK